MTIELDILDDVEEDSTGYLTVAFLDKDGDPSVPTSATYRIDCVTNNQSVRASTALTPASSIEIKLAPDDNKIISDTNEYEIRELTVSASYGVGDESHASGKWRVHNLTYKA